MNDIRRKQIEFGDFQTPDDLAIRVCDRLVAMGVRPATVIEPTCGVGAFVLAAHQAFPGAHAVLGFEANPDYAATLVKRLRNVADGNRVMVEVADFFHTPWKSRLNDLASPLLVLGNFPWVTNSTQGALGSTNLPKKANHSKVSGFSAMTGSSNFDISEAMLIEVLQWFNGRSGDVAMLVKTSVARKILAYAVRQELPMKSGSIIRIDAKAEFAVSVEACLLVMSMTDHESSASSDFFLFDDLTDYVGRRFGSRAGINICDVSKFDRFSYLFGVSPQKWRSGIKHDQSAVMEFTQDQGEYLNGLGETVDLESTHLYPLMKGSDVGTAKPWRKKFVLSTQTAVGQDTGHIETTAPKTWAYLLRHADALDRRKSRIYEKSPRFSVFGVGDYAFRPWKIAICGLYKHLNFTLVGPIEGRPVLFDDTVCFVSFDTFEEATKALSLLRSPDVTGCLEALIFWDDKRPVKSSILNLVNWELAGSSKDESGRGRQDSNLRVAESKSAALTNLATPL